MNPARRSLVAWLLAEVCSLGGTRLSMVAIPWLVLTTTGSAALTGTVALVEMLPYVAAKALGGPLIDRLGSRRIAVTCDGISVVVIGLIPLLAAADRLSLPALMVLVGVAGLVRGPSDAAKHALVPALARHADVKLERVTGLAATVERLAASVGAAAAGALVALVGPAYALAVNAVTFACAALLVGLGLRSLDGSRPAAETTSYLDQLRGGWQHLRTDRLLMIIVIMVAGTNFLDQAWTAVYLPVWVRDHGYGADTLGLVLAVLSGFSVGGAVLATAFGPRLPRLLIFLVGFLAAGLPRFAVMAIEAPLIAVLVVMAIAGFASGFINPILGAVMFERIPEPLVGRVSALINSLCWSLIPLGGLAGGLMVAGAGLDPSLIGFGVAYLALTVMPTLMPTFRQLNQRRGADQSVAAGQSDDPSDDAADRRAASAPLSSADERVGPTGRG